MEYLIPTDYIITILCYIIGGSIGGGQTSCGNFWGELCFEMVRCGAKVKKNAVHWFSSGYSEKTDLRRLINFLP